MPAWTTEFTLSRIFRGIIVLQIAILAWLLLQEPEHQYRRLTVELGRSDLADLVSVTEIILPLTAYVALLLLRRWGRLLLIPAVALSIVLPSLSGLHCAEGDYGSVVVSGLGLTAIIGAGSNCLDGALLALAWASALGSSFTKETHKGVPFLVVGGVIVLTLVVLLVYLAGLGASMRR